MLKDNKAMIGDFGFARCLDDMEQIQNLTLLGTPYYMSPQILRSDKFSAKCDVWSVGVVFYQMLFGKLPWSGHTQADLYKSIKSKELEFPSFPEVPPIVQDLISRMLGIEESQRYSWPEVFSHPFVVENIKLINQK